MELLMIELIRQYGQLSTAYVSSKRDYCPQTEERLAFLSKCIIEIKGKL